MSTLTTPRLLKSILKAYRTHFPMLELIGTQFDESPLTLGETVIAHIRSLPSVAAYDAGNGGYENGAEEGRDLLSDVPITVDQHKHVPIKWSHIYNISDQKRSYEGAVEDAAWVLGRDMITSILNKATAANVSGQIIEATANIDLETLEQINSAMNIAGASPAGRMGIISTAAAGQLALDTRIASGDYYGQRTNGTAYRVFRNIAGFQAIYEYPAMPDNNKLAQTFTAATTDIITANAHGMVNGTRIRVSSGTTLPAGLTAATNYYVRDATVNTFKVSLTVGGAAVDITDTGTGVHTLVGYENLTGFFFEASAVAVRAGIPEQTSEYAKALGIPQTMGMEVMKDPETGFTLALMKWQKTGTADLYVSPTALWGSSVGRQGGAAGTMTDIGGYRLVSAG